MFGWGKRLMIEINQAHHRLESETAKFCINLRRDESMPEEKTNPRQYNARVEYRAVQKEVEQKVADGYRAKAIHAALVKAGRLTISYTSFCDYLRGNGERSHGGKKKSSLAVVKKSPSRSESGTAKSSSFVHDRNVDLSELV